MAQEATHLTTGAIKNPKTAEGTLVRPNDNVTVYATNKVASAGIAEGDEMVIHSALAEKLMKSGKVTDKAPSKK